MTFQNQNMKRLYFFSSVVFLWHSFAYTQTKGIDSLFKPYVETKNFSGNVLVAQNGKVLFSKAYGPMNRSYNLPLTTQTKFYLASVSMIFTSAAIMKLVDEGKISLIDPLSKYLPDYKHGNKITLHNLMSQRSGIMNIGFTKKANYDSLSKFHHTIEQLISYFKEDSLVFQADTRYSHARSDYILLAYIIEKVTGKPYGSYLKQELFDPLQMKNTGHSTGEKGLVPDLAAGYAPVGHFDVENAYQIDWTSKTGHGSIYSTTEDLNKFANAILSGKILSKQSWQKIFTDYGDNVGYGWFISDHLDKKRVQMNGRSPGFSSYFGIYPDEKFVVIILSNNDISLPSPLGKQVAALMFNKPYTKTNLSVANVSKEQAQRLIGKYKFDEKFYRPDFELEVLFNNGKLSTTWGALIPVDEGKQPFKKFILRSYWSDIEFVENRSGQIEAMMFDGFRGSRLNK
jgi:CubicO group peptidase (beta-lactamase class C family)